MVAIRADAFEKELHDIEKAYEKEKEAHTTTKQEVVSLRIKLRDLERIHETVEGDLHLVALKYKLRDEDAGVNEEREKVHTDDKELQRVLPDVPVHSPKGYRAPSLPLLRGFNSSIPPSSAVDNRLGERSKCSEDKNIDGSTRGTKQSVCDMNSDDSNCTPAEAASKIPLGRRVAVCIRCYQKNLRCDSGEPCQNCVTAEHMCKRAKCNDYETGTCKRASCLRAHREDEEVYNNIVRARHIRKIDPSKLMMPKTKKQRKNDDDENKGGAGNPRSGGTSTGIAPLAQYFPRVPQGR